MLLIITPAVDGLKREWREAAESLGASGVQYWRMVALPVLWPSLLGTFALLFANAFGAVATAMALTGSSLSIVPIILFAQIRGDVSGSASRLCHCLRHDRHHRHCKSRLHRFARAGGEMAEMKIARFWSWLTFALGFLFFFLPLIGTLNSHCVRGAASIPSDPIS